MEKRKKRIKIMAKPNTPEMAPMPPMDNKVPMPSMPPMPSGPSGEGSVMVQVPKSVFMDVHSMIVQLAQTIDALALEVEATTGGKGAQAPTAPAGMPSDADLEAFAAELNQRGAM
jgi:hypothetical protein